MSVFPTTVPSKTLAQNLSSSGTTLYLNNTLSWDGVQLSSSDFGTQLFAVLRNPSNTQLELIELDPATVTSSNAITILKRGLPYNGDTTADTETKYNWSGSETICELGSDTPQLLKQMVDSAGDETIAGVKTFSSSPIVPTPTTPTQAANKSYVDGVAIAGAANASTTVQGLVEEATQAEVDARTATGGTGAKLFAPLDKIRATLYHDYAADAGANDTYVITITPAPTAYTTGMVIAFKANTVNTGACTINVNSLGAKSLKVNKDLDPQDGYIKAGADVIAMYDGTNFQILSVSGKPAVSQSGEEIFAASSSGNDTYAITVAPTPAAYVTGQRFYFKPDTANTGAATLNVNSLGAKSILRPDGSALANGDIAVGQIVGVAYDGTNMLMVTPLANSPKISHGAATRAGDAASGTQNIAHGLGRAPRMIRIDAMKAVDVGSWAISNGTYDGSTTSCVYIVYNEATAAATTADTTNVVVIGDAGATSVKQVATVTVDATNIILSWTKTGSPTNSNIDMIWRAEA